MYYPSDTWVTTYITLWSNKAIDTWTRFCLCVCFGTKQSKTFALTSLKKECGFHGKPHINWPNHALSCSESILGRGQTDKCMPVCPLPKNQSSKSVKSHALVITCVHIIFKKSNKSIPWFIRIDFISDLIDDLINLIKSMPTLVCKRFSLYLI